MSLNTWQESLLNHKGDGTALTAAARASLLQGASATRALYTFPSNFFEPNKHIRVQATGRISCAATTPGTARFDISLGGIIVWDSLAINLNVVAKTNVHWHLDANLVCQAAGSGTTATLFPGICTFTSEAVIASPLPTVGGSGIVLLPYNTAPVVGAGFTSVVSNQMDLFFTQTVGTGSVQLHTLNIQALN
jgi:hypothetical protein